MPIFFKFCKKKTQNYGAAAMGGKKEKEGKNKGVGASLQEALQIILADRRILLTGLETASIAP